MAEGNLKPNFHIVSLYFHTWRELFTYLSIGQRPRGDMEWCGKVARRWCSGTEVYYEVSHTIHTVGICAFPFNLN